MEPRLLNGAPSPIAPRCCARLRERLDCDPIDVDGSQDRPARLVGVLDLNIDSARHRSRAEGDVESALGLKPGADYRTGELGEGTGQAVGLSLRVQELEVVIFWRVVHSSSLDVQLVRQAGRNIVEPPDVTQA